MSSGEGPTLPAVFDDLDIGVTLHDPDTGAILDVNSRLERLYGYAREELQSMQVEDFSAPATKYTQEEAIERIRAAASGDSQQFEWQIKRATGEVRWIRVNLNASTLNGESCVLAEIRDITDSRARERRLRLLSRILRHNLRNKTTAMIGLANYVRRGIEDESLTDRLEKLVRLGEEIGSLSESVTQLEEIVGLDSTERAPVNLRTLVTPLVEDLADAHPALSVTLDAPTDVWVVADRGLEYALEHALENAVEHNTAECPRLEVTIDERDGRGEVRIADNGPRIPEVEIDVLVDDVERSSTYHGTGVGLWVMQWAVDSLGGELSFAGNEHGGNTVTISLPTTTPPDDTP